MSVCVCVRARRSCESFSRVHAKRARGHVECSAGSEGSDGISEKGLGGGGYMSTLCLGWRAERPAWVGRATDGWPTELEKG